MFKSKEIPESSQTSNPFLTKTTPAGSPCTNELYIIPGKRRLLPAPLNNKSTNEHQLLEWEAWKKTINGILNKVNTSNLSQIRRELFKANIIRFRSLFSHVIIKAQIASPFYTPVYAALVSIVNTKFPTIGELICKRLISSFRQTYVFNKKRNCIIITKFIAHLLNQNILHEIIALQISFLFLENPTDDGVILTIVFLKACGQKLSQASPIGFDSVFSKLTNLLHKSSLNKRTKDMIEDLFAIRNDQFKAHPAIISGLDLVDEKDQHTHTLQLDDFFDSETMLDGVFQYDKQYEVNEEKYKQIRKRILDDEDSSSSTSSSSTSSSSNSSSSTSSSSNSSSSTSSSSTSSSSTSSSSISSSSTSSSSTSSNSKEEDAADEEKKQTIIDQTQTDLATFRRTIYLTIQSSISAEECNYKLRKMNLLPEQEMALCQTIVDTCGEKLTYEAFFGLLGQHLCSLKREYIECFQKIFGDEYEIIHRRTTVQLENVAKFFAHLLVRDSISWGVFKYVRLTEADTTSSSRVYLKYLFVELFEFLGIKKLKNHLSDPTLPMYFRGLFLCDSPENAQFSINFFTSIGLGKLV